MDCVKKGISEVREQKHHFVVALRDLMNVINAGYQGMIIGGMAIISLGYPRVTTDIDATILITLDDVTSLVEQLRLHDIVPRIEDVISFASSSHVLLMRHEKSGIDIDISIAMLPFEKEAISNSREIDFAGVNIRIPRPEDMIIYKMVGFRPEDIRDVEEILLRHFDRVNIKRVKRIVGEFANILERPEMIEELKKLIKKTEKTKKIQDN